MNGTEYFRKTISATGPLDVNVLYLGGMPQMGRTIRQVEAIPDRSEITKPPVNFKGIIQDVQVTQSIGSMGYLGSLLSFAMLIS
jgi:protein crumbs